MTYVLAAGTAPANDWRDWLGRCGVGYLAGWDTSHEILDGRLTGEWPDWRSRRIYAAIDADGVFVYVGQTTQGLRARIRQHSRNGNARDWRWVVSSEFVWPVDLDALEKSAAQYLLTPRMAVRRRHPSYMPANRRQDSPIRLEAS